MVMTGCLLCGCNMVFSSLSLEKSTFNSVLPLLSSLKL
jgi:hypothetical protein